MVFPRLSLRRSACACVVQGDIGVVVGACLLACARARSSALRNAARERTGALLFFSEQLGNECELGKSGCVQSLKGAAVVNFSLFYKWLRMALHVHKQLLVFLSLHSCN